MTLRLGFFASGLPILRLAVFLFFPGQAMPIAVQAPVPLSPLQQKINTQRESLAKLESTHASVRERGFMFALLGAEYADAGEFTNSEKSYNQALKLLGSDSANEGLYAEVMDGLGALYRIYGRIPDSLNCRRKAYDLRVHLGDPLGIARSRSHLAELALMEHNFKDAFRGADQAYKEMTTLNDDRKDDLLSTLIVRAYAQCAMHRCTESAPDAHLAVKIAQDSFQPGSMPVGAALMALGTIDLKNHEAAEAKEVISQALEIFKVQLTPTDPRVNYALLKYRDCMRVLRMKDEEHAIDVQLAESSRGSGSQCSSCTVSAYGLVPPQY